MRVSVGRGVQRFSMPLRSKPSVPKLLCSPQSQHQPGIKPSDANEARVLRQLLAINASMFVVEAFFGVVAQSTGLLGDALDMLSDALVYGMGLLAVGQAVRKQKFAARLSGWSQVVLAALVLLEVARRALQGSDPASLVIMAVGLVALAANLLCVGLLRRHRAGGVHMQASWIFSTNDAVVNLAVVIAGLLVHVTNSPVPDLVAGVLASVLVTISAVRILRLAA